MCVLTAAMYINKLYFVFVCLVLYHQWQQFRPTVPPTTPGKDQLPAIPRPVPAIQLPVPAILRPVPVILLPVLALRLPPPVIRLPVPVIPLPVPVIPRLVPVIQLPVPELLGLQPLPIPPHEPNLRYYVTNISNVVDPFHLDLDPDPQIRFVK